MGRTICVDSNVAAKWAFPEDLRLEALTLRGKHVSGSLALIAPDHFAIERVSIVRHKYQQGRVNEQEAREALGFLFSLDVGLIPVGRVAHRTLEIANLIDEDAWDAAYIAVAEAEQCDFWTADKELARRAKPHFPFVKLLGEDAFEQDAPR